jgi:hypothetical protein
MSFCFAFFSVCEPCAQVPRYLPPPSSGFSASSLPLPSISRHAVWKSACKFLEGYAFDLKIAARRLRIRYPKDRTHGRVRDNRCSRQISGPQQFVILKRFPAVFHGSKVALKTMQCVCRCGSSAREVSWVNCAAAKLPGQPVTPRATNANTSCRESLEILQGCLHRPRMSFENPLVIAEKPARETDFGGEKVKS